MKSSRREFIEYSAKISAAALLSGVVGSSKVFGSSGGESHPNVLLLLTDQQRIPPQGYGPNQGVMEGIREILGFQPLSPDNPFTKFFPGYLRLRKNAVILRTHYTASSACVPSRACIMTGSYSTRVDDTDQLFKTADARGLTPHEYPSDKLVSAEKEGGHETRAIQRGTDHQFTQRGGSRSKGRRTVPTAWDLGRNVLHLA